MEPLPAYLLTVVSGLRFYPTYKLMSLPASFMDAGSETKEALTAQQTA